MTALHRLLIAGGAIAGLLACAIGSSKAVEVNFAWVIVDQDDKPMTDCAKWSTDKTPPVCDETVPLTLGRLALAALNRGDDKLTPQENIRRGMLARRVWKGQKLDIDASDIELIKTLLVKLGMPPVVIVSALDALDPAALKK